MAVTNTSVTVGNTTTVVLPADGGREQVFLQNDSGEDIYLAFDAAAVMNKGMLLSTAGKTGINLEQLVDKTLLQSSINAISASGSMNLLVIYS